MSRLPDCHRFETRLEALSEGRLDRSDRAWMEMHADGCSACRELLDLAGGSVPNLVPPGSEGQVRSILARTSGSSCSQARGLLGEHAEGILEARERDLLGRHLEHCTTCRVLAETLEWVLPTAGQMAELPPDPAFCKDVLAATSRAPASRRIDWVGLRDGLVSGWQGLLARPRFAWEAAYVGLLVMLVLFGPSMTPFRHAPQHLTEAVLASSPTPLAMVGSAFNGAGRILQDGRQAVQDRWGTLTGELAEPWTGARNHAGELWQAVRHGRVGEVPPQIGNLWVDVKLLLRGARRGIQLEADQS